MSSLLQLRRNTDVAIKKWNWLSSITRAKWFTPVYGLLFKQTNHSNVHPHPTKMSYDVTIQSKATNEMSILKTHPCICLDGNRRCNREWCALLSHPN